MTTATRRVSNWRRQEPVFEPLQTMSADQRFPAPWSVEEQDGCFVVRDRYGQALSCVYFKDEQGRRSVATVFTRDEARHMAAAVAKLPELWAES
jgi:hypothetical protein